MTDAVWGGLFALIGSAIGGLGAIAGGYASAIAGRKALERQLEHEEKLRVRDVRLAAYEALLKAGDHHYFLTLRLAELPAWTDMQAEEHRESLLQLQVASQRVSLVAPRRTGLIAAQYQTAVLLLLRNPGPVGKIEGQKLEANTLRFAFWSAARVDLAFDDRSPIEDHVSDDDPFRDVPPLPVPTSPPYTDIDPQLRSLHSTVAP